MLKGYISEDFDIKNPVATMKKSLSTSPQDPDKLRIVEIGRAEVNSVDLVMYDSYGYGDLINNQETVDSMRNHLILSHANWRNLDIQVN